MIESDSIFATFYTRDHAFFSPPEVSGENAFLRLVFRNICSGHLKRSLPTRKGLEI
jgi:hypothetical protein